MPATLELAVGALVVGGVGGVALGVRTRRARRTSCADHFSRGFSLLGSSLPVFWIGLVFLFVLYARLGWFPGPGRLPPRTDAPDHVTGFYTIDSLLDGNFTLFRQCLWRLVLPCVVLGWAYMGQLSRLVRAAMLDEINSDYVRTARAKGLAERLVMRRHVLRNAWLPTLTILGFSFAQLLTGVGADRDRSSSGTGSAPTRCSRRNTLDFPAHQRRLAVRRPCLPARQLGHRCALRRRRPEDPAGMSLLSTEPRLLAARHAALDVEVAVEARHRDRRFHRRPRSGSSC